MIYTTFAAIDVGSYELSMKIYEVTRKSGMHQVDHLRRSIDLGSDSYARGKLSYDILSELCDTLREYRNIMDSYGVEEYVAYGTSAIRETVNTSILLDQIEQISGIRIDVLSNSEQRFIDYKSIAFQGEEFERFIEKNTVILDIGGGSIQMSVFNKDNLVSTENLKMGVLRLLERMTTMGASRSQFAHLIGEYIEPSLNIYKKLYLRDREIENLIIVDDYIAPIINKGVLSRVSSNIADYEIVNEYIEIARNMSKSELARRVGIPEDAVPLLYISLILLSNVMTITGATRIWAPGVTLCDGIAYEYAEKHGLIKLNHNFEDDIIAGAHQISKRYMGSKKRSETLSKLSLQIFEKVASLHGLTRRDGLLLEIAAILHDCGKYISMADLAECSYHIIMSTEIMGLSHKERMIVANTVKYNQLAFEYFEEMASHTSVDFEDHMRIAKLTAILRLANGLDRSHKDKFRDTKIEIKGDELIITTHTDEDITLERELIKNRADFFREVFHMIPVIKQKRSL